MFWRKKLKTQIATLLSQEEKHLAEIRQAKDKELHDVSVKLANLQSECNEKDVSIAKLQKQIREQTEADLFFVSAQICLRLLRGDKKVDLSPLYDYQRQLQQQIAAIPSGCYSGQQQYQYGGLMGLLGIR